MLTPRNVEHQVAANIFLRGDKPYLEYPERRRNQTIVLKVDEMKKKSYQSWYLYEKKVSTLPLLIVKVKYL